MHTITCLDFGGAGLLPAGPVLPAERRFHHANKPIAPRTAAKDARLVCDFSASLFWPLHNILIMLLFTDQVVRTLRLTRARPHVATFCINITVTGRDKSSQMPVRLNVRTPSSLQLATMVNFSWVRLRTELHLTRWIYVWTLMWCFGNYSPVLETSPMGR